MEGTHNFDFALYDAETDGNLLWQENHSSVMVTKGLFDLILGSENPLPDTLSFSAQYWLQVSVDGEILSPRIPLASVPYSFRSLVADSVVNITLDTLQAYYDTLQLQTSGNADVHWDNLTGVPVGFSDGIDNVDDADNVVGNEVVTGLSFDTGTGELSLTQNAGISPITQNLDGRYALSSGNVTGSGLDNYISRWNGTSTLENSVIYQTDVGNVGIGTTTPSYKLDVSGTGRYTGALTIGAYTLPASDGTGGYVLKTDGSGNVSWQADDIGTASPAGADGAVQYNNGGAFGGNAAHFYWNDTNDRLAIGTSSTSSGKLTVSYASTDIYGIYVTMPGWAIYGDASGAAGRGVMGRGGEYAILGNHLTTDRMGYIASEDYGVYGRYDADRYGFIGSSSSGVEGHYIAGTPHNYGKLGTNFDGVEGHSEMPDGYGVWGEATIDAVHGGHFTGPYGVWAYGDSIAVYGEIEPAYYGFIGLKDSTGNKYGIWGRASTNTAGDAAVYGYNGGGPVHGALAYYNGSGFYAVYGQGLNVGVYGTATASSGNGVYGDGNSIATGVLAITSAYYTDANKNAAVWAQNDRTTNTGDEIAFGVVGTAKSDTNAVGVYGTVIGLDRKDAKGVFGVVHSSNTSFGVLGINDATSTNSGEAVFGIYGKIASSGSGAGVYGISESSTISGNPSVVAGNNVAYGGIGRVCTANNLSTFNGCPGTIPSGGVGVAGWAQKYGIAGYLDGSADGGAGVWGWYANSVWGALGYYSTSLRTSPYASVYGYRVGGSSPKWAGYFDGDIFCDTLVYINQRSTTLLRTTGEETDLFVPYTTSPEIIFRDRAIIPDGVDEIYIEFPDEFSQVADPNERIDVMLTPIGTFASMFVDEISIHGFEVKIDKDCDITGEIEFLWVAFGKRWFPENNSNGTCEDEMKQKIKMRLEPIEDKQISIPSVVPK
ncbi:hypothetical protein DRQ33_07785 [bacterium]|nr:MAG: hypothetical protein DRQ33_07785 [bacterium]